jgi:hypothetical protein
VVAFGRASIARRLHPSSSSVVAAVDLDQVFPASSGASDHHRKRGAVCAILAEQGPIDAVNHVDQLLG